MKIVTDRACDISPEQLSDMDIHFAPMRLTLDGKTYSSGVDLSSEEFYKLLEHSQGLPVTSQATAGDFAQIYNELAEEDPDILSIHISSGLSGTMDSAINGAKMAPKARVTHWDTKTLSAPEAWQVEAAARGIKAGWQLPQIMDVMGKIRDASDGIFTVETLKYLIAGGRISHLSGMVASLLNIRPVISVEKVHGKYYTIGKERTSNKALQKIAESLTKFHSEGSHLRVQLLHANNPPALVQLKAEVDKLFQCTWLPTVTVGPILGAHTGSSLVGLCAGPGAIMGDLP